jgi:glyoxylase I family protein
MQITFDRVTIVFTVADIDRTAKFYRGHLGFQFERIESKEEGLPDGGLDTLIERLANAGVEIVTPVSEAPGGWLAAFRDSDGQVISFFQVGEKPRRLA